MIDTSANLYGELANWPTQKELGKILRKAGLRIYIGKHSIRVEDCDHFVFQECNSDQGKPVIDANADSVEDMLKDGKLVSNALSHAGIRHRFEIYDHGERLVGYLHYNWPQ